MNNEELFFLCVLSGAEEILGIENPVSGMDKETVISRWQEVSHTLYIKEVLYDKDGEICIRDDYAKIAAAVSFPDIIFNYQDDEGISLYIYVKASIYVHLKRNDDFEIRLFPNRDEFIEFINQEFDLSSSKGDVDIETISTEKMNEAVEYFINGDRVKAIKVFEGHQISPDIIQTALSTFTEIDMSKVFVVYKQNQEESSQALFKTVKTDDGTWLFKFWNQQAKILRSNPDTMLAEILNF